MFLYQPVGPLGVFHLYIIGETRDSVIRNAGYIASFTSTYYRRYLTLDVSEARATFR